MILTLCQYMQSSNNTNIPDEYGPLIQKFSRYKKGCLDNINGPANEMDGFCCDIKAYHQMSGNNVDYEEKYINCLEKYGLLNE